MQWLNNLFIEGEKWWHHLLYANPISFFATGKYQKIPKINENS